MIASSPSFSSTDVPQVTYLVLAHRDAPQIARLAGAVRARTPGVEVVAAYNGPLDAGGLAALGEAQVRRVGSGRPASWGDFSLVERVLEALADIDADRCVVVVSGDSHPSPALARWVAGFVRSGAHAALDGAEVLADPIREAHLRYHWRVWRRPAPAVARGAFRMAGAIGGRLGTRRRLRVMPEAIAVGVRSRRARIRHAYGSQWFAISPAGRARLNERLGHGELPELYRDVLLPDESFFHTLALLDDWCLWREPVMFTIWPYEGSPHPRQVEPADLPSILTSGAPFVRKVAGPAGEELARLLDEVPAGAG